MDALDLLRYLTKRSYAWLETNVADITHDQANWRPAGTANSIAATFAHTVISADVDLNLRFHEREPLIAGEWGTRVGLDAVFPDDWNASGDIRWEALRDYARQVRACVEALVDSITMADLERSFEMKHWERDASGAPIDESLGVWKGIDVYTLHGVNHITMHGGEIACLKGLQGKHGYRKFRSLPLR